MLLGEKVAPLPGQRKLPTALRTNVRNKKLPPEISHLRYWLFRLTRVLLAPSQILRIKHLLQQLAPGIAPTTTGPGFFRNSW